METLAVHPAGGHFVMAGRLRGGAWNAAFFSLADGALRHSFKTETRVTHARFAAGGRQLILAGARSQPGFKDGAVPAFGHLDVYELGL
jgi:hypothetical protein